jgi:hypothetical protein
MHVRSRRSVVSIMSNCGLDDRVIKVRSLAERKDSSSSLFMQTGCGAHPAFCPTGTGGSFSGLKRDRCVTLTTHPPISAEVANE